jgi:F-box interacting protein
MGSALARHIEQGKLRAPLAAGNDGTLPTDVLREVLLRLPVDVLCRLRLVCRSWLSLTSDPTFANAHASRHPLFAGVHVGCVDFEVRVVELYGKVVRRVPDVRQACYGLNTQLDLVCVSSLHAQSPSSVLDLTTGKVVAMLPSAFVRPDTALFPFLLGHVPSMGQLKVFYSCRRRDHAVQACSVTTLGDGGDGEGWRAVPSPPALVASGPRDRVVIGGFAYFLLNTNGDMEPDAIAMFDLAEEEWRPATLQGPLSSRLAGDDDGKKKKLMYHGLLHLAAMDGCLVTVHHNGNRYEDCSMDLWFFVDMDADKGLWTKRFSICRASWTSHPLLLLDDGRIAVYEERAQVLRVYDPRTSKWADTATLKDYLFMSAYQGNLLMCPRLRR